MVNKKNVCFVRRLNLEYGGLQLLGTGFFWEREGVSGPEDKSEKSDLQPDNK